MIETNAILNSDCFRERVVQIGTNPLNGIITYPKNRRFEPVFAVLNSGLLHHVGSCRLSVDLCRLAARQGFVSLRFDFAGIGDSPARQPTNQTPAEETTQQLAEIFDYLAVQGIASTFVIGGLCSAADSAFSAAAQDQRVRGIFQIDPYLFRTPKFYALHYLPRLFQISAWLNWLKRTRSNAPTENSAEAIGEGRHLLSKAAVESGYKAILQNQTQILALVTGEQTYLFNYAEQFCDMYSSVEFGEQLEFQYYPNASHMMLEPDVRGQIKQKIIQWLERIATPVTPKGNL